MESVLQPKHRGTLRQIIGKEFYILKRKLLWLRGKENYSTIKYDVNFTNEVFSHKTVILRRLKDVEMYLQENKKTNLEIANKKITKTIIKPNETFSFWKLVGRPSKRKGYLEGLVLKNGKIDKGIGGGLCQLGNLLFWIFAHSPLTIVERYRHGFDVFPDVNRKVPFGAGATLSYNYIDLQVKNNTKNSFSIDLWLDESYLNGALFSKNKINETYEIVERNHIIKQQSWGGYTRHNQIVKITRDKDSIHEQTIVENNAILMYRPFLEQG